MSAVLALARHRVLVGVGIILAAIAGLGVLGHLPVGGGGPAAELRGAAQTRVLVDTPDPLAADLDASTDTIGVQTSLLGDLMAGEAEIAALARAAGIPAADLVVLRPGLTIPAAPSRLGTEADLAVPPKPYVLTIRTSTTLPIVLFDAYAPDRTQAAKLAKAATTTLQGVAKAHARDGAPGFTVTRIEPISPVVDPAGGGRSPVVGLAVAILFLCCWCGAIVLGDGAWRSLRGIEDPAPRVMA